MFFLWFLFAVDFTWTIAWFIIALVWQIILTSSTLVYWEVSRKFLFHTATTAFLAYCALGGRPNGLISGFPLLIAFLSDIDTLLYITLHLTQAEHGIWVTILVQSCVALTSTILATFWFISYLLAPKSEKPVGYPSLLVRHR
jgi:hypothetical protein